MADAKKQAETTITDNIATIDDNIKNITDDIATLQDLADKNPGDEKIAGLLDDAQTQLSEAESAKTQAQADLDKVKDQTTLADVADVVSDAADQVSEAQENENQAQTDVEEAQKQSADNLADAKAQAEVTIDDKSEAKRS